MEILKKIFVSSEGEGLAKRWESFFTGIIPAILVLSTLFGWGITEIELNSLVASITLILSSLVAIWKAFDHIYGWIRAIYNRQNKLGKFAR